MVEVIYHVVTSNLLAVARLKKIHKHGYRFWFTVEIITYKGEPKPWHFSE